MSKRLSAVERAQRKLEQLASRGANSRALARQKERVEQRAFVAHEHKVRLEARAARERGDLTWLPGEGRMPSPEEIRDFGRFIEKHGVSSTQIPARAMAKMEARARRAA